MDPIANPFAPGAGSPPPELVGRGPILDQADILLGRVQQQKAEKSILLTGLRGVGKTVLLNAIELRARSAGYLTIQVEAHEDKTLAALLVPHLRSALYEMNRVKGAGFKVKRALAVLRSFISTLKLSVGDISFGLDIEPERGSADSGDLEADLASLFAAVAEAAVDRGASVALFIDEIQYFNSKELGALIMAMHKVQQKQLPLVLVGAGLPVLPGLAGDSKSYAERLFSFPNIGPLTQDDAAKALAEPTMACGVRFEKAALAEVFRVTRGYPYFLQEWGYQSWNLASGSAIRLADVRTAADYVIPRLDQNFFRVRFDRLTPGEKRFLRVIAELGEGNQRMGAVADLLGVKIGSQGPIRAKLIRKGMIYSPGHGDIAFTVPLFSDFMVRVIPEFKV